MLGNPAVFHSHVGERAQVRKRLIFRPLPHHPHLQVVARAEQPQCRREQVETLVGQQSPERQQSKGAAMRTRRRPRRSESEWRQRRPEQRLAASHAELLADAPLDMVGQCDQRLRPRHQLPLHAHLHGQPVARVQVGVMHDDREGNAQGGQCRSHHHVEQCRHGADRDVRTPGGDVAYEGPPAEAGGQQAIEEAGGTVVGPHRQLATDPRPRTV